LHGGERIEATGKRDLLENIRAEADRLVRLVNNLLEMTRLESGRLQLRREPNHIEDIIGTAIARISDEDRKIRIIAAVTPGLPLIRVDSLLLEQVLVNLMDNALKYSDKNAPVEVSAASVPGSLVVSVSDRGPGILSDELDRLFDKFYRGSLGATAHGSGLGLAICKGVVEAHGGSITAGNREGGGAVFQFNIPLDGSPA
jgi:two-component system sensor histidine kinase KdpD